MEKEQTVERRCEHCYGYGWWPIGDFIIAILGRLFFQARESNNV